MRFLDTRVAGAWLLEPDVRADDRGFFARLWSRDEFTARGLNSDFVQANNSFSNLRGTLRGLHWQAEPHGEAKLVRCIQGRIFDVIVDMRPASPTYLRWAGAELGADDRRLAYVPEGCAHGYLTLDDRTEVIYAVTAPYAAASERGLRWNDPAVGIEWPMAPPVLSAKDRAWPDVVPGRRTER
jgi:dTDP-4-dehydrorhamnose 3,5-epimerase